MSNPYSHAIEALKAEIAQKESDLAPLRQQLAAAEAEITPLKTTANFLLEKAGLPKEYTVDVTTSQGGSTSKVVIRQSQFFNKEPSEAAVEYLAMKHASEGGDHPTPAMVDEIYAALVSGHCKFGGVSDTTNKNALKTALSRNTAQVAKISDGLYGLRKWYGMRAARRTGDTTSTTDATTDDASTTSTTATGTITGVVEIS